MSRDLNLTITDDNGNPVWATFIFSQTGQKYTFTDIYDIGGKHFRLGLSHPTEGKNAGKYIISRENSADEIFDSMDDVKRFNLKQADVKSPSLDNTKNKDKDFYIGR